MKKIILTLTILTFIFQSAQSQKKNDRYAEINSLIKRILPKHASRFSVAFIEADQGKDVFEIEQKNDKIILRGNNGISIASALNYYLKNITKNHISWNGSNLQLPATLPPVKQKIRIVSPHQYRYYLNYCTFNYTMSWWNWERWEKEIDWLLQVKILSGTKCTQTLDSHKKN